MSELKPKPELLVFNKKEVGIILMLLGLVALFSFTIGLKLGKSMGAAKVEEAGHVQIGHEDTHADPHKAEAKAEHADSHAKDEHANAHESHAAAEQHDAPAADTQAAKEELSQAKQDAEAQADQALAEEVEKTKAGAGKTLPMALPSEKKVQNQAEKKSTKAVAGKYTLQVGSHRTLAEASDQVKELKKRNLDAFYMEAEIPGKGTWYRVGVGLYATRDMAEKVASKMKSQKALPSFIVQKVSE